MTSSLGPKLVLAFALALTVPLKAMQLDTALPSASTDLPDAIVAFLTRHHFKASWQSKPIGYLISASSGDCHLRIREVDPFGINIAAIKNLSAKEGQLALVFNGSLYYDYPKYKALLGHYWIRVQQRLGRDVVRYPIIAVAASESCSIDTLPWIEIEL